MHIIEIKEEDPPNNTVGINLKLDTGEIKELEPLVKDVGIEA